MSKIRHFQGTMTSRQRVVSTFNYEKADRVPINYITNSDVHNRFAKELGIKDGNYEEVLKALDVDFRGIHPSYTGPNLFPQMKDYALDTVYGTYTTYVPHDGGGYWENCYFPLKDAPSEAIAAFPVPSADDFDYETAMREVKKYDEYALHVGNGGYADIINSLGRVMGMEDALVNIMLQDEATLEFIDKRLNMQLGILERLLDKGKGRMDFMWLGEDLGTQYTPMIGTDLYDEVFLPRHQKFVDLAKAYNVPVLVHTCGSSSWVYERFIEMGIKGVDTLQPEAANMSPQYLKETFGGRLAFHGCISTAGALATGNKEDVIRCVKETLDVFRDSGGYMLAPTHCIQNNTPVENIVAMYQAAHDFGEIKSKGGFL